MTGVYGICDSCKEDFHSLMQKEDHVCLMNIKETHDELQATLVKTFTGVPLLIDDNLTGNMWYVAVSKELYEAVQETKG